MIGYGSKVKIIECHKIPELVGRVGQVVGEGFIGPYPLAVAVDGALYGFRPDELAELSDGESADASAETAQPIETSVAKLEALWK